MDLYLFLYNCSGGIQVKRLLAIAAILCLAQPVQANPYLAAKFEQLRVWVAANHPEETDLISHLSQYQIAPCPVMLCAVVAKTIGSVNPQLQSLLDNDLLAVEAEFYTYCNFDYCDNMFCVLAIEKIQEYKNARGMSSGPYPFSVPKRQYGGNGIVAKRARI